VLNETAVRWNWFVPAVLAGFVGVVLVQMGQRREVRATGRLTSNMRAIQESLRRITQNMARLSAEKQAIDAYEVRHRLEELFADDLTTFITARESIAHSYGLAAYADVMSCFAAGERYLNRAWCASADGYVDEIHRYIDKAKEQFASSLDKVLALQAAAGPQSERAGGLQPEPGQM
jgi:ATP-dependent Lon protease